MDGKNVLSLVAVLTIGFGVGLFTGSQLRGRSTASQIRAAVQKATDECEARHQAVAESAPAELVAEIPIGGTAATAAAPAPGVTGGSGSEMINRLLRQKPLNAPGADPGAAAPPAPPPSAPAGPEPPKKASARVLDAKFGEDRGKVVVRGQVKNDTEVLCVSATVTIVAHDRRGARLGEQSGYPTPLDIDPFGSAPFTVEFPAGTPIASVTGSVVCN